MGKESCSTSRPAARRSDQPSTKGEESAHESVQTHELDLGDWFRSRFLGASYADSPFTDDEYAPSDSGGHDYMGPMDLLALYQVHEWEHPSGPAEQAELHSAWHHSEPVAVLGNPEAIYRFV